MRWFDSSVACKNWDDLPGELRLDLLRRVLRVVQPSKIYLFGSAATGTMKPDSDLDLLVVSQDTVPILETTTRLYQALWGFPMPVDFLLVTPEKLEAHKDDPGFLYQTVLREGKEIYAA